MSLSLDGFLSNPGISQQLSALNEKYLEIQKKFESGDIYQDVKASKNMMIEYKRLEEIVELEVKFRKLKQKLLECEELLKSESDENMLNLIEEEKLEIEVKLEPVFSELQFLLIPKSEEDVKNVVMEIRAGTGGNEAALFAADLFRMYSRYVERKNWKLEILTYSPSELKGTKEVVFSVVGRDAYEFLKYENGVHRVQRIPETETSGRIHTSAVTVAVLPEIEETELEILDKDLKIDTYRASGAGGQHVNTTDSAIRITHLPSHLVVTCQDERSQIKNRAKAMKILRAKLYENNLREKKEATDQKRKSQVGSGDRSEKIRTYNFPQGRVSEHRTELTLYKIQSILEGDLDEIIESLRKKELEVKIASLAS